MTTARRRAVLRVPSHRSPTETARKRAVGVLLEVLVAGILIVHGVKGLARALRAPPGAVSPPPPLAVDLVHDPPQRLALLPGVGRVRAAAIVADRLDRGPYGSLDDLVRVHGIGRDTVRRIREAREVRPVLDGASVKSGPAAGARATGAPRRR